jgi:hypothetical protein
MRLFLDTSAFMKRYIDETGSETVWNLCNDADSISLSLIAITESVSTLTRLQREKRISIKEYRRIKQLISDDIVDMDFVSLDQRIVAGSIATLEACPLKALDALHVACALHAGSCLFVSADRRQLKAAEAMGLEIRGV